MATPRMHGPPFRQAQTPPPDTPQLSLEISHSKSTPIPNKHLPFCPPGPPASINDGLATPPDTPPSKDCALGPRSILQSPGLFAKANNEPPVYLLDAQTLSNVIEELASQPLPDAKLLFPWLHGLHEDNQMQLAFFAARRGAHRNLPTCLRGLLMIKADGDLSRARLKGAVSPDEVLEPDLGRGSAFVNADPRKGFCVRNFHIQVAKLATVADILVYGDDQTDSATVRKVAISVAEAQRKFKDTCRCIQDDEAASFSTFLLSDSFSHVENAHSDMVDIDQAGSVVGEILDFGQRERYEMYEMGKPTEIARNVWLGPTPDCNISTAGDAKHVAFNILVEASDLSTPPETSFLHHIGEESFSSVQTMDFPSSGSILPQTWSRADSNPLIRMCQWMYAVVTGEDDSSDSDTDGPDSDGDIQMRNLGTSGRKILIHCTDGYTETTMLAVAYIMYAERMPLHDAWLHLHKEKKRNFFAYPSDVALLQSLESRLTSRQSSWNQGLRRARASAAPEWLCRMDGSLPSRILKYLYLGNLGHANNPGLLRELGISQILSIGEPVTWTSTQLEAWGQKKENSVLFIDRVQDNGVDPLIGEFGRCLEFIAKGKARGVATLVHCRVGVSRSATICIAELMHTLGLSFPRAYCLVRARRLNVIIQPHLRFVYELMQYDEVCQQRRGETVKRSLEWANVCREIASINRPYCAK